MNEDDTFRRLKRIPFSEMHKIRHEHRYGCVTCEYNSEINFEEYGWTEKEYFEVWRQAREDSIKKII